MKKKPSFRLSTLVKIADKAYDDDGALVYAYKRNPVHDKLATFVVDEIEDTYASDHTREEQLTEAARVIGRARAELEDIENAFNEHLRKLNEKGRRCKKTKSK